MTPAQLRALVPLRTPRTITLACWPWVPILCAAVDGYLEALMAVYDPRGRRG